MRKAAATVQGGSVRPRRRRRRTPPLVHAGAALFLDLDGTLFELAPTPDRVAADPALHPLLIALAQRLDGALALVTGRALADVDRLLAALPLPVAALHGASRRRVDGVVQSHASAAHDDPALRAELTELATRHRGLRFEDKGMAFALHYREAPALASFAHRTLRRHAARATPSPWALQRGKGIVELRPHGYDKGTAIAAYMEEPPFAGRVPMFVGDDVTDEAGFAAVNAMRGHAIKVGRGPTCAAYRLPGVAAVREWLVRSIDALGAEPATR